MFYGGITGGEPGGLAARRCRGIFRAAASLMLRGGFRRRLSSFAKTTAGVVELKISASGLFSSDLC